MRRIESYDEFRNYYYYYYLCELVMRDLLFRFHPNLVVPIDEDGTKNT